MEAERALNVFSHWPLSPWDSLFQSLCFFCMFTTRLCLDTGRKPKVHHAITANVNIYRATMVTLTNACSILVSINQTPASIVSMGTQIICSGLPFLPFPMMHCKSTAVGDPGWEWMAWLLLINGSPIHAHRHTHWWSIKGWLYEGAKNKLNERGWTGTLSPRAWTPSSLIYHQYMGKWAPGKTRVSGTSALEQHIGVDHLSSWVKPTSPACWCMPWEHSLRAMWEMMKDS